MISLLVVIVCLRSEFQNELISKGIKFYPIDDVINLKGGHKVSICSTGSFSSRDWARLTIFSIFQYDNCR